MSDRIELAALVGAVADQLRDAALDTADVSEGVMRFEECELEMAFSAENRGKAGIAVWLLDLGGERTKSQSNTVRVRFSRTDTRPVIAAIVPPQPGG